MKLSAVPNYPNTNSMVLGNATTHWEGYKTCIASWLLTAYYVYPICEVYRKPMMEAYQEIVDRTGEDIIAYIHDDVMIYEKGWDLRVLKEFEDPTIGMVGFGGAVGHGDPNMYKVPYQMVQFARRGFLSNMRTAEAHGGRFSGERDVAVFDGFAIFVRRKILKKHPWPVGTPVNYWIYDYWISCETRRQGYRNRLVGVDCEHLGGKSPSIVNEDIEAAHLWLYDRYSDVLPYEVPR